MVGLIAVKAQTEVWVVPANGEQEKQTRSAEVSAHPRQETRL